MKFVIFRPQRGSFKESMAEAKEFDSDNQLLDYIVELEGGMVEKKDLSFGANRAYDPRNGWRDSQFVTTKKYAGEDCIKEYGCPQCIGMCAHTYI